MNQSISPTTSLSGSLVLPPDKSISHRSVILNSLAKGSADIKKSATAADCQATIGCIRELGVDITSTESTNDSSVSVNLQITSPGQSNLSEPMTTLDAQNSGTTMRLLMGLLASAPIFSVITGDNSLRSRPMSRKSTPLSLMGANIIGR